jgi:hypothetical protein
MAVLTFGPIYCEDSVALASFPVEPINTISNAAIVLFGLATLYLTWKRAPRSYDLYGLGALLILNGIGSGLWHGTREPWALVWDVTPGLIFLFALAFCWARRLWTTLGAILALLGFYMLFQFSREYFGAIQQRWVAIAPAVVLMGMILVGQTAMRSKPAALWGLAAIASSLAALGFRSVDLQACAYIPFGTHFLWHILNSAGAFMGVVALVTLQRKTSGARPRPSSAAAVRDAAE